MEESKRKKIVMSITKFLQEEKSKFDESDVESLEVAIQCLEDLYKIDKESRDRLEAAAVDLREVLYIEDVPISKENEQEAEDCKNRGNNAMSNGEYNAAIEEYSKAIALNPKNAVYYCNRAAVFNKTEQPLNAILDGKKAIKLDPKYSKAFARLGKAYSLMGLTKEAHEAYVNALNFDPNNEMYRENLKYLQESGDVNAQPGGPFNNSTLLNMIIKLMESDSFREMLETMTAQQADPPYMNSLIQLGQMLVNRISAPELFQQLKIQPDKKEAIQLPKDSEEEHE